MIEFFHSLRTLSYWRHTFLSVESTKIFFEVLGALSLVIEINSRFNVITYDTNGYGWLYLIFFSLLVVIWRRYPPSKVCCRLPGTDIKVEIRKGDLFKQKKADIVISTNTTFDTDTNLDPTINTHLISPSSVQGIFTEKYYDNLAVLDHDIDNSLQGINTQLIQKTIGKNKLYSMGTVAKLAKDNRHFYLLAMANINNYGVAQSSLDDIKKSLRELWQFIATKGSYSTVAMPVIGTGSGRVKATREDIIKLIVKSFTTASQTRIFIKKLIIVIHPSDYKECHLNLFELADFIRLTHKYELSQ